jgi:hypothetical protein
VEGSFFPGINMALRLQRFVGVSKGEEGMSRSLKLPNKE